MQKVSKTGRTYTQGSSSAYAGWESKQCAFPGCDVKLTHRTGGAFNRPVRPDGSLGEPWSTCVDHIGYTSTPRT